MDPRADLQLADDGISALFRTEANNPAEPESGTDIQPSPDFLPSMVIADGRYLAIVLHSEEEQVTRAELTEWAYIYRRYQVITKQPAMIVHQLGSTVHFILRACAWKTMDKTQFECVSEMMSPEQLGHITESTARIPRPRNQFMLYRQWMSEKLRAENEGMTAGCISQVVANMWRSEKRYVKDHFKRLANEEERRHAAKYPGYRYDGGRDRVPHYPRHLEEVQHNPMAVAMRLIEAGL